MLINQIYSDIMMFEINTRRPCTQGIITVLICIFTSCSQDLIPRVDALELVIVTWNVPVYPEKRSEDHRELFSEQISILDADVLCVQEIANQIRVDHFLETESSNTQVGFLDSSNGQDNAIFSTDLIEPDDIDDPIGFQHSALVVYVTYNGYDAIIVTVHPSWKNEELREQEKQFLSEVVESMLILDPDVIVAGDFNTKEDGILDLAKILGLKVMIPSD